MTDKLPPKILVVEGDDILRTSLCNTIERYWFNVIRAFDQDSAIRFADVNKPNVTIVSAKTLESEILDFVKKIRKVEQCDNMPIIVILEESAIESKYANLEQDDLIEVMKRPYTPNEMMTQIKNLLRRSNPVFQDKVIKYKDVNMDLATYKVTIGAKQVHLGPTEFKILQLLVQSPKTIFSRQQILDYVWGVDQKVETRTVDVHVNRLRGLMKQGKHDIPFIKTIRSAGYCLNLPGERD